MTKNEILLLCIGSKKTNTKLGVFFMLKFEELKQIVKNMKEEAFATDKHGNVWSEIFEERIENKIYFKVQSTWYILIKIQEGTAIVKEIENTYDPDGETTVNVSSLKMIGEKEIALFSEEVQKKKREIERVESFLK